MCIILTVAHIPCTHTLSIWHHCIDAARSGTPCLHVRQHDRAVLSRKLCKECGGDRFFARRGGVAERGEGSPPPTRDGTGKGYQDDTDDSGYCSNNDVIREEGEDGEGWGVDDIDDFPLSPRATVPPRGRGERRHRKEKKARSLNRKASWRPNLKQELSGRDGPATTSIRHRESIDSLVSEATLGNWSWQAERRAAFSVTGKESARKRRPSTLLHPSSPAEETFMVQTVTALPCPQVVHIPKPSDGQRRSLTINKSTITTPNPPLQDETKQSSHRKLSTLLHPSYPDTSPPSPTQHTAQTIISIPPRRERKIPSTLPIPSRRHPHHNSPATTTATTATRRRRPSILHSSLSDTDSDSDAEEAPPTWANTSFAAYAAEQAEGMLLTGSARAARASRGWGRGGWA